MTRAMRRMRKYLIVVACIALVLGVAIGGTVAWLADVTPEVENTFTPSNITVELKETKDNFQIIPSVDIQKDPKVNASSNVPYYVFVTVTESNWLTGMTYEINTPTWTLVDGTTNVYYIAQDAGTMEPTDVLKGNAVKVANTITDETLETLTVNPKLTFTAYAIQQQNGSATMSPAEAWALLQQPGTR